MATEILVTGASGFVGRRLCAALENAGHRVHRLSIEDGDIARAGLAFPGVRHVFHLAARMFVPESWTNPRAFYETNVLGAVNALDLCRREKAAMTLVSSYVYGTPKRLPISEDHPIEAFNPYGHTKVIAESVARFYAGAFGVPVTIVRPFNIYGPGQDARFLIPSLIAQALDPASDAIRVADSRPKRDYLHVDDLVDLLLRTLGEPGGGIYNAGSGASTSIGELAAMIGRAAGTDKPLVSADQSRPQEVMDVVADITRARDSLCWTPRITLEEGLAETVRATRRPA